MEDHGKTKEKPIHEMVEMRHRLATLEETDTGRKQAEEALRASEAKSRALLEGSPVCTKLLDLGLRLKFMSAAGQEMLGITDINPFYGRPYADIYAEPHRTRIIEHLERAKAGEVVSLEAPAYDLEGREGWYHTTFVPVPYHEGRVEYIISTSVDITERKRAEEELERSARQQEAVAKLGSLALKGEELQDLMDEAVRLTAEALEGVELCKILKLEESSKLFRLVACAGVIEDLVGKATLEAGVGSQADYTLSEGGPVTVEDLHSERRFSGPQLLFDLGMVSGLSVPMAAGDFVFGVMGAHSTQRRDFSDDDVRFLEAVGNVVTTAVLRKRTEEALRVAHKEVEKAGEYLETLIEDSLDAIISTDKEGKVVLFNEGAEAMLGYRREEVFGQRVTTLYESEERAKEVMRRMREKDGRVAGFETTLRAKDGNLIPVLISASILYDEEGEEAGTVGFNKDLRERKRAEEELIRSDKLAALGRLTAGVSHEILNPLNIITMSLQLMLDDPETHPPNAEQLRILEDQAQRINKITQELLYFARQRKPERRWIDVNQTLSRTLSLFEKELRLQNVAVELKLSEGLEDVLADQDQLLQVVLNLLTNAKDAMPGGGRLILSTEVVEADGQRFVEVRVEDTGPGIPPEHMEKLFDPFFTTKGEVDGMGLGLSICHGIIQAHGGSIRAESESGRGTTFIIQLPIELTTGIETD